MDLARTIAMATAGLKAQTGRMRIAAENLANSESTASKPGADPYRRKVPVFRVASPIDSEKPAVLLAGTKFDRQPFPTRIDPGHPAADASGAVKFPNVDPIIEQADLRDAQRSYEANLNVIAAARRMMSRTIDILRG
jgi:flagellar basal-body rod protein FlgC